MNMESEVDEEFPMRKTTFILRPAISETDPHVSRMIFRRSKLLGLEWISTKKNKLDFSLHIVVESFGCRIISD